MKLGIIIVMINHELYKLISSPLIDSVNTEQGQKRRTLLFLQSAYENFTFKVLSEGL